MKAFAIIFLTLIFTNVSFSQVNVGDEAPGFSLQVLREAEGTKISLSDYPNKVVFIFFYGAGCPHCRSNGGNTETKIHKVFETDSNFVALGIDTWNDPVSTNNSFQQITEITYPLLLNGGSIGTSYFGNALDYDRAVVIDANGKVAYKGNVDVTNAEAEIVKSKIEEELAKISTSSETIDFDLPNEIRLNQNYPNPFNPSTTISYQLSSPTNVKLEVFNLLGELVSTLVNEYQLTGEQSVSWNASQAPSGVYIYRLTAGNEVTSKQMMLIK